MRQLLLPATRELRLLVDSLKQDIALFSLRKLRLAKGWLARRESEPFQLGRVGLINTELHLSLPES